jgi:hypothetical protein
VSNQGTVTPVENNAINCILKLTDRFVVRYVQNLQECLFCNKITFQQ